MKFNIKYTIAALSVFMFTAGCDDKLDAIDVIGYTGVPVAIETVTSESLPGQEFVYNSDLDDLILLGYRDLVRFLRKHQMRRAGQLDRKSVV